jgi:hypothetical protein
LDTRNDGFTATSVLILLLRLHWTNRHPVHPARGARQFGSSRFASRLTAKSPAFGDNLGTALSRRRSRPPVRARWSCVYSSHVTVMDWIVLLRQMEIEAGSQGRHQPPRRIDSNQCVSAGSANDNIVSFGVSCSPGKWSGGCHDKQNIRTAHRHSALLVM